MSLSRFLVLAASAAALASLGACSGIKQSLGLENRAPDEFTVVARAPLELPPDYTLRPPRAGTLRPQDQTPTELARNTVFRAEDKANAVVAPHGEQSVGEAALLKQAGAENADPNIRRIVTQENTRYLETDRSFIDTLVFWKKAPEPGIVVDPTKEAERLRQNAASGKAATDGETPIIERKKKALLEGILPSF
ncbi:MAG: DUF3035 domain-containing protein [Alphaproteobacteria bacterium]|nr:DUF3035 domain-containing protein [Alphaproteobacteria bacterium]